MHLGASGLIFERARALRNRETKAERILWEKLSKKQLGVKFRRQHPIATFIVDFYCHSHKLAIELDGTVHDLPEQRFHDKTRTGILDSFEVKVIRFTNQEVHSNVDRVVESIRTHLKHYKQ